ncbi:MAG: undecaprenyldiphospho-muramoylpentapeptide beta-N-acetylglucosaminyltransferase [Deltaproteobacteria bacterium]|nr:MAG: undecaprenyldiphospho-muramoylpentapeptide beta-N-acetylglucosaminyltransferase [Deltaproteobacteria bacterium]
MRVLIAGGGTGGHLYPGIALAQEFMTRHQENEVLFVGTRRGLESEVVPREGFPIEFIEVSGLKRVGLWKTLKSLWALPRALFQSLRIVRRYRPGVCIAVGGYASGPVALAAWLCRVPVIVQEQNALPGLTSRIVARFARKVCISFERSARHFPRDKVLLTGNPVRLSLMDNFLRPERPATGGVQRVLVFGGSQGARALNEAMVGAMRHLAEKLPELRLLHQTGRDAYEGVRRAYEEAGLIDKVDLRPYIHEMSEAYARSAAVVCRAGATTLAELTVARKASILVPFPYATDNHQEVNARALAERGAAVLLLESELTPERLASELEALLTNPDRRHAMEKAAGELGHPEAAKEIADVAVELWMDSGGFEREQKALARKGGR